MVDTLALEASTSYGGTRKPAAALALKTQLYKAAQRLPSLAAASVVPPGPEPEVTVVVTKAVVVGSGGAADEEAEVVAVVAQIVPEAQAEPLVPAVEVSHMLKLVFQYIITASCCAFDRLCRQEVLVERPYEVCSEKAPAKRLCFHLCCNFHGSVAPRGRSA